MSTENHIALLIDADNSPADKIDEILEIIEGEIYDGMRKKISVGMNHSIKQSIIPCKQMILL